MPPAVYLDEDFVAVKDIAVDPMHCFIISAKLMFT
jgi:hypothetical protein